MIMAGMQASLISIVMRIARVKLSPHTNDHVLVAGAGDVGMRMAKLAQERGQTVDLLVRNPDRALRLRELGWPVIQLDLDDTSAADVLAQGNRWHTLYYTIPPASSGDEQWSDERLDSLLQSLERAQKPPEQCIYISTSGVYGDHAGGWVNEETPPMPVTPRAKRRLAAENLLFSWCDRLGKSARVIRVPGIYGPGRLPIERIRQQIPVIHPDEAPWSNRIHADDLAAICVQLANALADQFSCEVFNVSDGHPSTMTQYFFDIADIAGWPRPPTISLHEARKVFSPQLLTFLDESRRLDITKLLQVRGIDLKYSDSREGIRLALMADGLI